VAYVLSNAWALLLGMLLLMIGNGLQGTLLAVRGGLEGFNETTMSVIMTGYFLGFLVGSRLAPQIIARVGHVRAFAALASLISAAFIIYPAIPDPIAWTFLRVAVGVCISGVYVVAESWLNDISTNETRGQALSAYLIVQMVGIIAAQAFVNIADPSGYTLFVVMSVLVSISFAPILLSVSAAPVFETTKRMTLLELYKVSPLGCVGSFFLGGIFAAQFGMGAVYATAKGLSLADLSVFVSAIYIGGLLMQYPLGYISDKMDRRVLIIAITGAGGLILLAGTFFTEQFYVLLIVAFVMGGVANPLYSLLIAYTNDYLKPEDMPAASSGLIFLTGVGSVAGPVLVGYLMTSYGADSFFVFIALLFLSIAGYGLFRMTQRAAPGWEDTGQYAAVAPQGSPVFVEVAQEYAIDMADEDVVDDETVNDTVTGDGAEVTTKPQ